MYNVIQKSKKVLKEEGIIAFLKKLVHYIVKRIFKIQEQELIVEQEEIAQNTELEQEPIVYPPMVDILFINGCDSSVPHPARYRVTHQREQLIANNITSDEVYYVDLKLEQIKYANLFIFFRCPHTTVIEEFIQCAKKLNKTVLFDIDDLVVDTKYTNTIKYVQNMGNDEKALYDDGVLRMGHTLRLCEGAITTTERLAHELGKYVPNVYINRNTASEKMYELSENVNICRDDQEVRIGYFSGSITHNDDFCLVMPALCRLFSAYPNLRLYIVGELELPIELQPFTEKIVSTPFVDWQELPQLIASVDINLAPLEQSIFNEAKSENKWVEAALVKVPTVASNTGAFAKMIQDGKTGFLCNTNEQWYEVLEKLIVDETLRKNIGIEAYKYVKENCLTMYTGLPLCNYIRSQMKPSALFIFPSTEISGGIMVALKHAVLLQKNGYNVTILAYSPSLPWMEYEDCKFPVIGYGMNPVYAYFDKAIATMWSTTPFIETHPKVRDRFYLVQNYEVDFYEPNVVLRLQANQTYNLEPYIQYITISKWCQKWLKEKYNKEAVYAPNGIAVNRFNPEKRTFNGKVRILIEGDCAVEYKKVDESFLITNQLNPQEYEIWYMSYNEEPKEWYRYDKFLHRVSYEDVPEVYRQCDILLKSSILESFSYPPLEMMASGGFVVVVPNGGNIEYLKDGYNCLFYESGNAQMAISCIERIRKEKELRERLIDGAKKTVEERDWAEIELDILSMYRINLCV